MDTVDDWLAAARGGDRVAGDAAFAAIYADLRRLAQRQLAGQGPGLGATSLVHEVYMKMARPGMQANDRQHFFAIAARAMRQLVVDDARERAASKRGGGQRALTLDEGLHDQPLDTRLDDLLVLDQALDRLAALDRELASLVELRFFGGLELEEISQLTGRSERSLKRDWRKARAVLHAALAEREVPHD